MRPLSTLVSSVLALALGALAARPSPTTLAARDELPKYAFAHFMVGVVADYVQADWELDMRLAMDMGLDAFALNIGKDSYNKLQLAYAYTAAETTGFKVFLSFDFAYWNNDDLNTIASYLRTFAARTGQLKIGDKSFVSTFFGDGFPWRDAEAAAGVPIYAAPVWGPDALNNNPNVDAGMQWNAWPSANNQPIDANYTTDGDLWWIQNLNGKPYMAPVSPWFFTHYSPTSFNKNWLFLSDYLWGQRWDQILQLKPQFLEIITWNDFGESHYIGPLHPDKPSVYAGGDDGAVQWVTGMPHDGFRDVAAAYISAFKASAPTPNISKDELVYYYRPNPKDAPCSDPLQKPDGADLVADAVFAIALLTAPGTVVITSGANAPVRIDVPAGATTVSAPMGVGKQVFALERGGAAVFSGTGLLEVSNACTVNNFNVFVGTAF
ncbi:glycoside hydrolase family 71 protein [Exidia glandulosa HHB12029]|uniref:Glycoside hydrolase family 71 protein n=1 Tax=Exidia glandulosa HHB12029 TaxID=1314781 RepID=A0A165HAI8_EXIGL|nr:glycoside hydrolase family 71 protein [Exidia glandulosa HHB12029]